MVVKFRVHRIPNSLPQQELFWFATELFLSVSFGLVSTEERGFIPEVTLSLRQKQTFYRELQQFVRSGIPLSQAVEALASETGGDVRRVLKQLLTRFLRGESVPDAFRALKGTFSTLEVSMIEAAGNTGRLEAAFIYLASYFEALDTLRSGIFKRSLWPVIQLHFGVLVRQLRRDVPRRPDFEGIFSALRADAGARFTSRGW